MSVKAGPNYIPLYFKLLCLIRLVTGCSKPFVNPEMKSFEIVWNKDARLFPLNVLKGVFYTASNSR